MSDNMVLYTCYFRNIPFHLCLEDCFSKIIIFLIFPRKSYFLSDCQLKNQNSLNSQQKKEKYISILVYTLNQSHVRVAVRPQCASSWLVSIELFPDSNRLEHCTDTSIPFLPSLVEPENVPRITINLTSKLYFIKFVINCYVVHALLVIYKSPKTR